MRSSFDGKDDNVTIEDFGVFTTTTVSAWVRLNKASTPRGTVVSYKEAGNSGNCGFMLGVEGQVPKFSIARSGSWPVAVGSSAPVTLTQWVHLAGTYDGNTLRLYRNGQQVATATAPGGMDQCSGITAVGSRNSKDQHWFPGGIDEVRIYGRGPAGAGDRESLQRRLAGCEAGAERRHGGAHELEHDRAGRAGRRLPGRDARP